MALPIVQAVGTIPSPSTSQITVPWPAHQAGDLGLLFIKVGGTSFPIVGTAGWTRLGGAQSQSQGVASTIEVYYRTATNSSQSSVTVTGGNPYPCYGVIMTVRNARPSSVPQFYSGGGWQGSGYNGNAPYSVSASGNQQTGMGTPVLGIAFAGCAGDAPSFNLSVSSVSFIDANTGSAPPGTSSTIRMNQARFGAIATCNVPVGASNFDTVNVAFSSPQNYGGLNTSLFVIGVLQTVYEGSLSSQTNIGSVSFSGKSTARSQVDSYGYGYPSFVGTGIRQSAFSVAASSDATMIGKEIRSGSMSASGTCSVSGVGASTAKSVVASQGANATSYTGSSTAAAALNSIGQALSAFSGSKIVTSEFSAAGIGQFDGRGSVIQSSSFSSSGTGDVDFDGDMLSVGSLLSNGSSLADFSGSLTIFGVLESDSIGIAHFTSSSVKLARLNASGSSLVRFFAPQIVVSTIIDGSSGTQGGEVEVDWSACDYARVTLENGSGVYSIEHIKIISGKTVNVSVTNSGAVGSLVWDFGDAPVDWGDEGPPAMPANGETLHVEFRAESVNDIKGRLWFPPANVQEQIDSINSILDRSYAVLFDSLQDSSSTGSSETDLHEYGIQAGRLSQDGDKFLGHYTVEFAGTGNSKRVRIRFNQDTILFDTGSLAITDQTMCQVDVTVARLSATEARAVATIGVLPVAVSGGNTQYTSESALSDLDFATLNTIKITGTGVADDDVLHHMSYGEFKPAAS